MSNPKTDPHGKDMAPSPWFLRFLPSIKAPGNILDLAAGGGRYGRWALDQGHQVVLLDRDTSNLDDLRNHPTARVMTHDLENGAPWPFKPATFDGVMVSNYLHRPLFDDLAACLASNGLLIYETFAKGNEQFGKPSNPAFLLHQDELLTFRDRGLQVIAFEQGIETMTDGPRARQRLAAIKSEALADLP